MIIHLTEAQEQKIDQLRRIHDRSAEVTHLNHSGVLVRFLNKDLVLSGTVIGWDGKMKKLGTYLEAETMFLENHQP